MNGVEHSKLLACRDYILTSLHDQMNLRSIDPEWESNERVRVAAAANVWRISNGGCEVTVDDVLAIEHRAVGHSDYAPKLALYVAELVAGAGRG